MRKLLGLFSICALVGVAAGVNGAGATPPSGQSSATEYGRAQQKANGKVVASAGYDVQSTTYTLAPGGDTGWRTGPGTTALAVTKGALKVQQAEGCAGQDLPAGSAIVLPPGAFRLLNSGQEPVELLANFTGLSSGGGSPLEGPADPAPACAGFAAAAVANGLSAAKSFRGDPTAYYRQAHAGHGGGDAYGASSELAVEAGKDAFMSTTVAAARLQHRLVRAHPACGNHHQGDVGLLRRAATGSARRSRSTTPATPGSTRYTATWAPSRATNRWRSRCSGST